MISYKCVLVILCTVCTVKAQDDPFGNWFEWRYLNFTWPSIDEYENALINGTYDLNNNTYTGIKSYGDRVYISLPRSRSGTPVTLASVPKSPYTQADVLLEPYPSWELNVREDCDSFQNVQSMEIDRDGIMWVIDGRRQDNVDNHGCPPKIVLLDLNNGGSLVQTYTLPEELSLYDFVFLNDITIDDFGGGFAYISDASSVDPGIIVYSREENRAWKVRDDTMYGLDSASSFTEQGHEFYGLVPIDGIALSPKLSEQDPIRIFYYCALSAYDVYAIGTDVLRNENLSTGDVSSFITNVGTKTGQTGGMLMDAAGILYYGLMPTDSVGAWNSTGSVPILSSPVYSSDLIRWPDGFGYDDEELNLLVAVNDLNTWNNVGYNPLAINFRILTFYTGAHSYLYEATYQRTEVLENWYEWRYLNFTWPSEEAYETAVETGVYDFNNNTYTGIKSYGDRVYISLPRSRNGTPVTLASVPKLSNPPPDLLLEPFPSWELNVQDDCVSFQNVQSMEIDRDGIMWVIDGRRQDDVDNHNCPPKIVLLDLNDGGSIIQSYELPNYLSPYDAVFLNDIVVDDYEDGFGYISDASSVDPGIIVYSRAVNRAWKVRDDTMFGLDSASSFTEQGHVFNNLVPIDGIALSPKLSDADPERIFYYCALSAFDVYAISTGVLRDEPYASGNVSEYITNVGTKTGQTGGMLMDASGILYYGLMPTDSIGAWNSTGTVPILSSPVIASDLIRWPDGFGYDDEELNLLVAVNDLNSWNDVGYNPLAINLRILTLHTGVHSYLYRATYAEPEIFGSWYEWRYLNFTWPSVEAYESAIDTGAYDFNNNTYTGIKSYGDRVYISLPRSRNGTPVTLASVPKLSNPSPDLLLEPFPSWELNVQDDCVSFQNVQSMEIDRDGIMWVIDGRRQDPVDNHNCPPKIVLLDLNDGGSTIQSYTLPEDLSPYDSVFLNDIVVDDYEGGYGYISDASSVDPGIIVYSREQNRAWKARDDTMYGLDSASSFTENGHEFNGLVPIDGIALSPKVVDQDPDRRFYYCALSAFDVYDISTDVLRNEELATADIREAITYVGTKPGQTGGMFIDAGGILYYGLMPTDSVGAWNITGELPMAAAPVLYSDLIRWPDGFGYDDEELNLLVAVNDLVAWNDVGYNPLAVNLRILTYHTGVHSYLYEATYQPPGPLGNWYQWRYLNFTWPSAEAYETAIETGAYAPLNNTYTGIKSYRDRIYISLPRSRSGTPVTLASVPRSNSTQTDLLLEPFPSWELNVQDDCVSFQNVQSMEIDRDGIMWVIDGRRQDPVDNHNCPPKIVLLDLNDGGSIVQSYTLPEELSAYDTVFLNDIVVDDYEGGYGYISDASSTDPGIIVYSREDNRAWKVRDSTMYGSEDARIFSEQGYEFTSLVPIDGIALAPVTELGGGYRDFYYCALSSFNVYMITSSILRNEELSTGDVSDFIIEIGNKPGQTGGMFMDAASVLYYGLMPTDEIGVWETTGSGIMETAPTVTSDLVKWPDGFGYDDDGLNLLVAVNDLNVWNNVGYDPEVINFRILTLNTGVHSYLYPAVERSKHHR